MYKVSIIITCFNSKETIKRSVYSALSQDWPNKEIIIIDDFSTDKSIEMLHAICKENPELIFLRNNSNIGYPASLNKALKKTTGDFITIFDDDDDNLKTRISFQVRKILECEENFKSNLILCYSNRDVYKTNSLESDHVALAIGRESPEPHGLEVAEYLFGFPVNYLKVWGMFGSCTLMLRREIFNEVGYFDESFLRCSEWDFAIRAAFKGAYFIAVDKSLISMYKTPGKEKSGKIPLKFSLKLREKYKSYLESRNFYKASRLIAKANFYFNKKKLIRGLFFKLLAFLYSPILIQKFLEFKIFKFNKFIKEQ